ALHHVAKVAEVALVDHVPELLLRDRVELARRSLVDQVEELRERVAEAHAPPASVADVEDALHLRHDLRLVQAVRTLPVDRMASGGLEAAFACGHVVSFPRRRESSPPREVFLSGFPLSRE